jgi:hypothetical protein
MSTNTYTSQELAILSDNVPPPNFGATSLSFVNTETGTLIEDAITFDDKGNVLFKDAITQTTLQEILSFKQFIFEKEATGSDKTLYFRDKYNNIISLGDLYKKIFLSKVSAPTVWWAQTEKRMLDKSFELTILENFYTRSVESVLGKDGTVSTKNDYVIKTGANGQPLSWKGFWFDIPSVQVITPDYIDNKYAQILANISLSVRTPYPDPVEIIFRVYDATAGKELCRTTYRTSGNMLAENITIPMTYHGPLPDSPVVDNNDICSCITLQDYDNLALDNGVDSGTKITQHPEGYFMVPQSRHVLKIQWQTCSIVEHYIQNFSMGRRYGSLGETSLNVVIYDSYPLDGETMIYNGSFNVSDEKPGTTEKIITFDNTKFDFGTDYSVSLSTSRNMNVWVIHQDVGSFTVQWNRTPKEGTVDWYIAQKVKVTDVEDLEQLTNTARETNHFLFIDGMQDRLTRNVCEELEICDPTYGIYTFKYLLPDGGSYTAFSDSEIVNGYGEYSMWGFDGISGDYIKKYYRATSIPEYVPYFKATDNNTAGVWRYSGTMAPGSKVFFYYTPMPGYCEVEKEDLTLPTATGPRYACEKCNCIGGTTINFKIKSYEWLSVPPGISAFYYYEDIYGTKAYASSPELIVFEAVIENPTISPEISTEIIASLDLFGEDSLRDITASGTGVDYVYISGSPNVTGGEVIEVWQVLDYDSNYYGSSYLVDNVPFPDINISGMREINNVNTFDEAQVTREIFTASTYSTLAEWQAWNTTNTFRTSGVIVSDSDLAQKINDSLFILSEEVYQSTFARYFSSAEAWAYYLKTRLEGEGSVRFVIPYGGFLGVKAFGYSVIDFEPRLPVTPSTTSLPIFPGYKPIGNLQSLEEVIEYIRTAKVFNTFKIPLFPSFIVDTVQDGPVVVNGNLYNPLFDRRNYRLEGSYQTINGESVLIPNSLSEYSIGMTVDSLIRFVENEQRVYKIQNSLTSQVPIVADEYNSLPLKTTDSGMTMILMDSKLWDANYSINGSIEF